MQKVLEKEQKKVDWRKGGATNHDVEDRRAVIGSSLRPENNVAVYMTPNKLQFDRHGIELLS